MKSAGEFSLREGDVTLLSLMAPMVSPGNVLKLTAEVCPKCGKVEFYL